MDAVNNKISLENFEKYCDGVSIHKRFGVLCEELFKSSNVTSSKFLKEKSFLDYNFCYFKELITFYSFKNIEDKRVLFRFKKDKLKPILEELDTYGINKSSMYFDLEKTIDYEKQRVLKKR